jgi:energy-converting hydrogenase Eha subunit A
MKTKYRAPFRFLAALLTWVAIMTQYILLVQSGSFGGFVTSTLTYLGYFTILTNILVGLALSTPFLAPDNKLRLFFERPAVRAAIALYILVVMVVYWALLAQIHNPVGLSALANYGLHLIVPVLYILDWLVFAPKGNMSFKHIPYWILYPMAYGGFNIIRGMLSGFYPYPFINVDELGMGAVIVNMIGFTSIYAIGAAVFIGLGRLLSRDTQMVKV